MIVLAVACANLPFVNERLFGCVPFERAQKPLWLRLIELLVLYGLVGAISYLLETRIGNAFGQRWEFYAITGCLFVVLAYPGFVYRYLLKRRQ